MYITWFNVKTLAFDTKYIFVLHDSQNKNYHLTNVRTTLCNRSALCLLQIGIIFRCIQAAHEQ
jgi:hypothetical protein